MHVVCFLAYCTIDRVMVASKLLAFGALFALTGELTAPTNLDQDKLPPLIQHSFDSLGHIDDSAYGEDLIVAVHITVVQFVKPK